MTIIDIGAGAGDFTAKVLETIADAKVICYEASQRGVAALEARFLGEPRVTIIRAAVIPDGTKGPAKLYCGNDFRDSSLTPSDKILDTYEICPVITVSQLPPHDLLNVETNGGEAAIKGEAE